MRNLNLNEADRVKYQLNNWNSIRESICNSTIRLTTTASERQYLTRSVSIMLTIATRSCKEQRIGMKSFTILMIMLIL